jgi:hypothetical protein
VRSRGDPKGQSGDTLKLAPDYADTDTLLRDTRAIGQNRDPSGLLLLLLLLQIMRAGSGDWRGEVGGVRGKKIDMQPGGYIRYGTTILTVQYRRAPSSWHDTRYQPGQTPVCDAMASYMYMKYCCTLAAMLCRVLGGLH